MWPTQVLVLEDDCNISGPYGTKTAGRPQDDGFLQGTQYPNHLGEWTSFFFRDKEGNSNHLSCLEFQTTLNRIGIWQTQILGENNRGNRDEEYFRLMSLVRPYTQEHYNYRQRTTYNLAWAYHDYGPYPSPIPELLAYMKAHTLFQKLVAEGIERMQSPFLTTPIKHAKKTDPKQRPAFKKSKKLIPL